MLDLRFPVHGLSVDTKIIKGFIYTLKQLSRFLLKDKRDGFMYHFKAKMKLDSVILVYPSTGIFYQRLRRNISKRRTPHLRAKRSVAKSLAEVIRTFMGDSSG